MRCKYGGEGGIRTLDTVLSVYPLSRRAPSAVSATSPLDNAHRVVPLNLL